MPILLECDLHVYFIMDSRKQYMRAKRSCIFFNSLGMSKYVWSNVIWKQINKWDENWTEIRFFYLLVRFRKHFMMLKITDASYLSNLFWNKSIHSILISIFFYIGFTVIYLVLWSVHPVNFGSMLGVGQKYYLAGIFLFTAKLSFQFRTKRNR